MIRSLRVVAAQYVPYVLRAGMLGYVREADAQMAARMFRDMALEKRIVWQDTPAAREGVSSRLRKYFPVPGFGVEIDPAKVPGAPRHQEATPEQAAFWYWYAYISEDMLYSILRDFCLDVHKYLRKLKIKDGKRDEDDFTAHVRDSFGIRRLCRFCWRPAGSGRATTCHLHSETKNPAGYMRAYRRGARTPRDVQIAFDTGFIPVPDQGTLAADALQALLDLHHDPATQSKHSAFFEILREGGAISGMKYRNFREFYLDFRINTSAGNIPADPRYIALIVPHVLAEIDREWTRQGEAREPVADEVRRLIASADRTRRGWQSEIARKVGISRQRVSKIAAEMGT